MKKVFIIGGGLAGLLSSIQLARAGWQCTVAEKKRYPFHRVCGEYISDEVVPFLKSMNLYPTQLNPPQIRNFLLTSVTGRSVTMPLDMGGFGISRFAFDHFLFEKAKQEGVDFLLDTEAEHVDFSGDVFKVATTKQNFEADVVIGSFGKRSKLDISLQRPFIQQRSPYVGVKYHLRYDHPRELIALHNFAGGYCGISQVENEVVNLCYLIHRDQVKRYGSIAETEKQVIGKNPHLKEIFDQAEFLFEKPEVINEISFETKQPVESHILMAGDAAGMITPLCGNGMAIAIRSSKILSHWIVEFGKGTINRQALEVGYAQAWKKTFSARLWRGRQIQKLFGSEWASNMAVTLAIEARFIARLIMKNTHGEFF